MHVRFLISALSCNWDCLAWFSFLQLASHSLQWVTGGSAAFLLFSFRLHFLAVLPLILYGLLPLWPRVGAEGNFFKSKAFSTTIRSLILDPWSLLACMHTYIHTYITYLESNVARCSTSLNMYQSIFSSKKHCFSSILCFCTYLESNVARFSTWLNISWSSRQRNTVFLRFRVVAHIWRSRKFDEIEKKAVLKQIERAACVFQITTRLCIPDWWL